MDISGPLAYLFPGISFRPGGECELQTIDGLQSIRIWRRSEPQPTPEQIAAAMLPAAIAQVTERIKAERDRRRVAGCPVGAHVFHSDDSSRIQQIGLVMMGASMPAGIQWKTVGGSFVEMTPTLAGQVFAAQAARDMALFAAAEAHIAALDALPDAAAVLAYDYSTSWPE